MMFTKYLVVVDDNVAVHNTSESPLPPLRQHQSATR
jgi:3-polyprenyl-4-hydroxybenzoate decarboxylase